MAPQVRISSRLLPTASRIALTLIRSGILVVALFLSSSPSNSQPPDSVVPHPIPPLAPPEDAPAIPPRAPTGLRVDGVDGIFIPDCSTSKMVELPLNWDPVDPNKLSGWITPKMQEAHLLCWAATTEMAVNYYGTILPQCQQVNDIFFGGSQTCCPNPDTVNGCDTTTDTVPQLGRYGFHVTSDLITDWSKIETYICKKQSPFLYFFEPYANAREHILVVYGYDTSVNHIFIVDPLPYTDENGQTGPSTSAFTFDQMFGDPDPEVHTRDFVDICLQKAATMNGGSCPEVR